MVAPQRGAFAICRAGLAAGKNYPDFIFAARRENGASRIVALETKGDQPDNLDTGYKRDLLDVMTGAFAWDRTVPAGTLKLVQENGETVECTLILMSKVLSTLPDYLK